MSLRASNLKVGDTHEAVVADNLTRTQIVQYAGASGDYNPLHTDEVFATKVAGYPTVFAHGMLTMAMTGHMLTDWVGDGRLTEFGVRFVNQVWPGDTLTATANGSATSAPYTLNWSGAAAGNYALTARATVREIREVDDGPLVDLDLSTVNQDGAEVVKGNATARVDP